MERKLEVVEFFILGPSVARLALSRMARQSMVGSTITMKTPWSSTCTCTRRLVQRRQQQDLSHYHDRLILHLQSWFFLAVSRPESGNCHEHDGGCTDNTSPDAHSRTFSRCALHHTWLHVWLKVWWVSRYDESLWVFSKSFLHRSCRCWVFIRLQSLLCFLHFAPHTQHQRPLQRFPLESDLTPVLLRSGMNSLAGWLVHMWCLSAAWTIIGTSKEPRPIRFVDGIHTIHHIGRKTSKWSNMVREAVDEETNDLQAWLLVARDLERHVRCVETQRKAKVGYRKTEAWQRWKIARYLLHWSSRCGVQGNYLKKKNAEKVGSSDASSNALQDQGKKAQGNLSHSWCSHDKIRMHRWSRRIYEEAFGRNST